MCRFILVGFSQLKSFVYKSPTNILLLFSGREIYRSVKRDLWGDLDPYPTGCRRTEPKRPQPHRLPIIYWLFKRALAFECTWSLKSKTLPVCPTYIRRRMQHLSVESAYQSPHHKHGCQYTQLLRGSLNLSSVVLFAYLVNINRYRYE